MMQSIRRYRSPLGDMLMAADETGLTGLWFEGQRYFARGLDTDCEEKELPLLTRTSEWLDIYFSGREPDFRPPLHFLGTPFQNAVWELLCSIPYGQTATYGQIANILAERKSMKQMSAQAVGGAVGKNAIALLVPCHRVVGSSGKLTGYAGGLEKKRALLRLEAAGKSAVRL